jgi:hypothetical protein
MLTIKLLRILKNGLCMSRYPEDKHYLLTTSGQLKKQITKRREKRILKEERREQNERVEINKESKLK